MKALLVLVLIAAISAQEIDFYPKEEAFGDGPTVLDFVNGFLKGIGETKNIDDLLVCLKSAEKIVEKIKEALILIGNMNIEDIIKGVYMIIGAVKELHELIGPCVSEYKVVEALLIAIHNADPSAIMQKIMINFMPIYISIMSAINCFSQGLYECCGSGIGQALKIIFLDSFSASREEILAFLKGFFEGIGASVNVDELIVCVKDIEYIIEGVKKAFEAIKTKNILKIIQGLTELFNVVKKFLNDLKPCAQNIEAFKRLVEALAKADISKIASKILSNFGTIAVVIATTLPCISSKDYQCIGNGLGTFLKIILL